MSAQYTAEPPTEGTLEMRTTHGPLHMGLWPHDAPKAARLFAQHVASNAYEGLPFHRIVPDLLVQSGNIPASRATSTNPVRAERNTRLRFRRRALVALVSDADDDEGTANGSAHKICGSIAKDANAGTKAPVVYDQFFITLADAAFLNGRHPIVATVIGDSVFNLLNIAAHGVVDDPNIEDVPRILGTSLTLSPFADLQIKPAIPDQPTAVPLQISRAGNRMRQKSTHKPASSRVPGIRSDSLLSFRPDGDGDGDEDEDDEDDGHLNRQLLRRPMQRRKVLRPVLARDDVNVKKMAPVDTVSSHPVSDGKKADTNNQAGGKSNVIAKANAEFERLRRELLGHVEGDDSKEGVSMNDDGSIKPGQGVSEETGSAPASNGTLASSTTGLGVADARVRKRRRRADEGEVLRRLQAFESRLAEARRRVPGSPSASRSSAGAGSRGGCSARQLETSNSVPVSAGEAMDIEGSATARGLRSPGSSKARDSPSMMAVDSVQGGENERAPWFASSLRLKPPDDDLLDYDVVDHGGAALRHQRQRRPR